MRSLVNATMVASGLLFLAAPNILAADAVTQCGAAQLKAVAATYKTYIAEGVRACVAGSAGHPQSLDTAKLIAATDKVNAVIQATIDKFGVANCFTKVPVDANNVINLAQEVANQLCLAPSPTPMSTP
jgi:hypothetical protein